MDVATLIQKVRQIEIKSRLLSDHVFAGEYHTAFKGRGMNFAEVREYSYGDDVRHIDWNVSARMQHPFVKLFQEERELTVLLMVDISASTGMSAAGDRKDFMKEIAAVLAFSVVRNQDSAGLLLFDSEVRKYLPPAKNKAHLMHITGTLAAAEISGESTNIAEALSFLQKVQKRKSIVFLISDFLETGYKEWVQRIASRHDLIGLQIKDPLDGQLPDIGLIPVEDAESGQQFWMDTSDPYYRKAYAQQHANAMHYFKDAFHSAGADTLVLSDQDVYLNELQKFFHQRGKKKGRL